MAVRDYNGADVSFFDVCQSHPDMCHACRDHAGGRRHRELWTQFYGVPGPVDFDCPFGKPWGHQTVQRPASVDRADDNAAVCRQCEEFNGAVCELEFPSGACHMTWCEFLNKGRCKRGKW